MSHLLSKNEKTETPKYIIFFDSESWVDTSPLSQDDTENREHKTYLIEGTFCKRQSKGNYKEYNKTYRIDTDENFKRTFWGDVDSFTKAKCKTWIFAHNARYDTLTTGAINYLIDLGYRVSAFSDANPFFMCFENKELRKKIMIVSSTNYFQQSLKSLGQCFGLEKMEIEYDNTNIDESVIYCKRDVEILKTAMLTLIEFIKQEDLGIFKMTIAGQAFNAYRHRFMEKEIFIHRNKESLILERAAYAGGRTEIWKHGQYNMELFYVDVNSMYPYVMREFTYPTKLITYRKKLSIDDAKVFLDSGFLMVAKVLLNTDKRIYFKKDKRLFFPVGEFETVLSTEELKKAIDENHIIKIKECNIYEGENIFAAYVNYFYDKRLEAKQNKNEVYSLLYKLFLNCLYGKFGQTSIRWEKINDADPKKIEQEWILDTDTNERYLIKTFGGATFRELKLPVGENEAKDSFPAIAGHVTANARMLLWDCIETAGTNNVYYMDTDSLFVNKEGYENLINKGLINENELGKLKLENVIEYFDIRGCKDYKYTIKGGKTVEKIKGVSKNSLILNDNEFMSMQWGGMSKGIKEGNLEGYSNNIIRKELKREYSKGIKENGEVLPFIYQNNVNLDYLEKEKEIKRLKQEIEELKSNKDNRNKITVLKNCLDKLVKSSEIIRVKGV